MRDRHGNEPLVRGALKSRRFFCKPTRHRASAWTSVPPLEVLQSMGSPISMASLRGPLQKPADSPSGDSENSSPECPHLGARERAMRFGDIYPPRPFHVPCPVPHGVSCPACPGCPVATPRHGEWGAVPSGGGRRAHCRARRAIPCPLPYFRVHQTGDWRCFISLLRCVGVGHHRHACVGTHVPG